MTLLKRAGIKRLPLRFGFQNSALKIESVYGAPSLSSKPDAFGRVIYRPPLPLATTLCPLRTPPSSRAPHPPLLSIYSPRLDFTMVNWQSPLEVAKDGGTRLFPKLFAT